MNHLNLTTLRRTALRTASVLTVVATLLLMMTTGAFAQLQFLNSKVTIDFSSLTCVSGTSEHTSDEPYVLIAVGDLATGALFVRRTSVFGDVDAGETRNQPMRLWGPAGVAATLPLNNPDKLVILVGPMEHDDCNADNLRAKVEGSLRSRFLTLRSQGISRSSLVTQLTTTMAIQQQCSPGGIFTSRDMPIGRPQELRITAADVTAANTGVTVVKTVNHDDRGGGSDGFYRTVFKVRSSAQTFDSVGTFELASTEAHFSVVRNPRQSYEFTWTVPAGQVWSDLQALDLRIGDEHNPVLWVRFNEADGTLALINPSTGEVDPRGIADAQGRIMTPKAIVYLQQSGVAGSGQSVTLSLSLSFQPVVAGHTYLVEVRAVDDDGNEHDFEPAGTLTVGR